MPIEKLIHRPARALPATASCVEGAELMREENIGTVVVARNGEPLGIVTDRDLAVRVVAEHRNPAAVSLGDIMSPYPVFLSSKRSLDDAIATMRDLGVRRLLVVDDHGQLEGVLSLDDILMVFARQLGELGETIQRELLLREEPKRGQSKS